MLTKISSHRRSAPADLVSLLLECHERIRAFIALAQRVGTHLEASDEEIIEACRRIERYFTQAFPLHVADEEEGILPRLRGRDLDVDRALREMHEQHARHGPKLAELLRATAAVRQRPRERQLRESLASAAVSLELELAEHLLLEETVVFPAVGGMLSEDVQALIVEELRQRRAKEDV